LKAPDLAVLSNTLLGEHDVELLLLVGRRLEAIEEGTVQPWSASVIEAVQVMWPWGRQNRIVIQVEIHVAPQSKASSNCFFKVLPTQWGW